MITYRPDADSEHTPHASNDHFWQRWSQVILSYSQHSSIFYPRTVIVWIFTILNSIDLMILPIDHCQPRNRIIDMCLIGLLILFIILTSITMRLLSIFISIFSSFALSHVSSSRSSDRIARSQLRLQWSQIWDRHSHARSWSLRLLCSIIRQEIERARENVRIDSNLELGLPLEAGHSGWNLVQLVS